MNIQLDPIGIGIAMILGYLIKNKTKISNQAIPLINYAVSFLTLLLGQIQPAQAAGLAAVGSFAGNIALQALVNTVTATGLHGGFKANKSFFLDMLKALLLNKAVEKAAADAAKSNGA